MGIGRRIRKLWRVKFGVVISLVVALFAAIWSVEKISLTPPNLSPRSLEMATATAHVIVDTPRSTMLDLRQSTYDITGLVNRAVVLGNVVASTPVELRIAARAHVPATLLRIQAPLTPHQASPPVNSATSRHITDIAKSTDQYRIEIDANPTVPMLDIYAQTPTADSAAALANAAVDELKTYLAGLATTQKTPTRDQIRVVQLGRATGTVINHGVQVQVAALVFVLTFLACVRDRCFCWARTGRMARRGAG